MFKMKANEFQVFKRDIGFETKSYFPLCDNSECMRRQISACNSLFRWRFRFFLYGHDLAKNAIHRLEAYFSLFAFRKQ